LSVFGQMSIATKHKVASFALATDRRDKKRILEMFSSTPVSLDFSPGGVKVSVTDLDDALHALFD